MPELSELDLQPVGGGEQGLPPGLDLQPVSTPPPHLDLQPVASQPPPSLTPETDKAVSEIDGPIIPRSAAQMEGIQAREFLADQPSEMRPGVRGVGARPLFEIPRIPQQQNLAAQLGAGLVNAATGAGEAVLTPQMLAMAPLLPLKPVQAIFAGQTFSDIRNAYIEAAQPGTTPQKGFELGMRAVIDAFMGTQLAKGVLAPKPVTPTPEIPGAVYAKEPYQAPGEVPAVQREPAIGVPEVEIQKGDSRYAPPQPVPAAVGSVAAEAAPAAAAQALEPETITAAALKFPDGTVQTSHVHALLAGEQPPPHGTLSGFVTSKGRFVSPEEARGIATAAKQRIGDAGAAAKSGGPGAASAEEYMKRYAILGAEKIVKGHTNIGSFAAEMQKELGSGLGHMMPEIFQRAQELVNQLEQASGKSNVAREINRLIGVTKAREVPVTVRPMTALKNIYQAAEKAGAAGYKRGIREGRAATKAALEDLRKQLSTADKWMAGDQEQVRRNMVDFVKAVLPKEERGRFINQITAALRRPRLIGGDPAVMYRQAFEVMQKIGQRAEQVWHEDARNEATDLFNSTIESSGVAVRVKDLLRERFRDLLDDEGKLDQKRMKDLSLEELEALREDARQARDVGRQEWKDKKEEREAEFAARAQDLATSPTRPIKGFELMARDRRPGAWTRTKDTFLNSVKSTLNWASVHEKARLFIPRLFETLDGQTNGWLTRNVLDPLYGASRQYSWDYDPVAKGAWDIVDKNKLTENDFYRVGVHMHAMQEGTEAELLKFSSEPKVMQALIDDYKKNGLTKGQQELADYFRKTLDGQVPDMKDFFADHFNKELVFYDNYFPRHIDYRKGGKWRSDREQWKHPVTGEVIDLNNIPDVIRSTVDMQARTRSVKKGFATARVEGAEIPVNLNSMDVFLKHMGDWLYVKNFQPHLNMVGRLVNTDLFATKYGQFGKGFILDYVDAVARRGQYAKRTYEKIIDALKNRAMVGMLGFRLNQFKHTANYPLGFEQAGGTHWWTRGQVASVTTEGQAFLARYAPEILRASAGDITIREASRGPVTRAAFIADRILDARNRSATFLGRYFNELEQKGHNWADWNTIPVDHAALNAARRAYVNAVGSAELIDRPLIVTRGTSLGSRSAGQWLMAYQSPKMVRWGTVRSAIVEDTMRHSQYGKAAGKLGLWALSSLLESGVKWSSRAAYTAGAAGVLTALGFQVYRRQYPPAAGQQIINEAISDLASTVPGGQVVSKAIAVSEYPHAKRSILTETGIPPIDVATNASADAMEWILGPTKPGAFRVFQDAAQVTGIPIATPLAVGKEMMRLSDYKAQHRADVQELHKQLGIKGRVRESAFQ